MVVRAHRGSWVMVKGARRRPVIARPVVAIACPLPRVVVLLISKRGWEEHGMVGYLLCVLKSTTNDIRRLSFGRHVAVSDVAPRIHKVGSPCYPWAVAFIGKGSFPFVSGRLRPWAVVFVAGGRLSSSVVAVVCLRSWAVVCVLGRSFSL